MCKVKKKQKNKAFVCHRHSVAGAFGDEQTHLNVGTCVYYRHSFSFTL